MNEHWMHCCAKISLPVSQKLSFMAKVASIPSPFLFLRALKNVFRISVGVGFWTSVVVRWPRVVRALLFLVTSLALCSLHDWGVGVGPTMGGITSGCPSRAPRKTAECRPLGDVLWKERKVTPKNKKSTAETLQTIHEHFADILFPLRYILSAISFLINWWRMFQVGWMDLRKKFQHSKTIYLKFYPVDYNEWEMQKEREDNGHFLLYQGGKEMQYWQAKWLLRIFMDNVT